ncbi:18 kDa heat shock protein [Janthinobacterium sp. HH103]|uniref:Hsp20/alpha crystallin family protein n=1 Tax=Janthinobacterium agaricidamnosum TaxID=55508 RepID=A0A3G2EAT8_9BURK|nr:MULTISPECIES: Hsp20/alpha crystallin family protein [Janthinobacterium]AYM76646.1 Hsp20/alpha crystallin family protein [Janthinobacterium agaricidamnosum]MCC7680560.1 Hsp20/alpha crystallin family protein [Janthinobacterium sp. FW305-128]OEZ72822.1 18 kDa heat shock protein [Janthinobacterium sp. HH100]OEZ86037.1 18 kDa heat shock protein [Janthinobacterium sp. HH103]OEZ93567.1 18 kDa heat shock protein [Janthinobacterium sp. HH106]
MANQLMRRDPQNPLARFDPFSDMEDFMHDFFAPALRLRDAGSSRMRVDISETEQAYQVQADIPGVNKDDIKVSIDGSRVSISAELKDERVTRDGGGKTVRSEREYGQQYRSFVLPHEVDEAGAQARYENGVLLLDLPKKEGTGGRQLAIQ